MPHEPTNPTPIAYATPGAGPAYAPVARLLTLLGGTLGLLTLGGCFLLGVLRATSGRNVSHAPIDENLRAVVAVVCLAIAIVCFVAAIGLLVAVFRTDRAAR